VKLSPHFTSDEFRCRHCGLMNATGDLVAHLELLRAIIGRPIIIVSGTRCRTHNTSVGGALQSRHLFGEAVDIYRGVATLAQASAAGFTGVGLSGRWAVHLDVRPGRLVTWRY